MTSGARRAGLPKEIGDGEKRVALSPAGVALLKKEGVNAIHVEAGAGERDPV